MKALIDALNVVYEEDEKRSFIRLNLVSLAFTHRGNHRGAGCGGGRRRDSAGAVPSRARRR